MCMLDNSNTNSYAYVYCYLSTATQECYRIGREGVRRKKACHLGFSVHKEIEERMRGAHLPQI